MIATQPKTRQILGINQQAYQSLKASMSLNLRRQLLIAVCDNVVLQNQLATQLEKDLLSMAHQSAAQATTTTASSNGSTQSTAPKLSRLTFDPEEGNLPRQVALWVRQIMLEAEELPAVQVLGIEQMTRQPAITQNYFLRSLEKVEALLPRLNTSLLVWVPWPWLRTIQESAPTFWKWRSGVFEFVSDPTPTAAEEKPLLPELSLLEDAGALIENADLSDRVLASTSDSQHSKEPAGDELYGETNGSATSATSAENISTSVEGEPTDAVQAANISEQATDLSTVEPNQTANESLVDELPPGNEPTSQTLSDVENVSSETAPAALDSGEPQRDYSQRTALFEETDSLPENLFDDPVVESSFVQPSTVDGAALNYEGEQIGLGIENKDKVVSTSSRHGQQARRSLSAMGGLQSVVSRGVNLSPPDQSLPGAPIASDLSPNQALPIESGDVSQSHIDFKSDSAASASEKMLAEQLAEPGEALAAQNDTSLSEAQKAERQKAADDYFAVGHVYRSRIEAGERGLTLIEPAIAAYEGGLRCLSGPHHNWGSGLNDLGTLYWLKAQQVEDQSQAIDCMTHSIQLYRQALTKIDSQQQVDIAEQLYSNMGAVYSMLATFEEPVAYLKQAAAAYQKALPLCEVEDYPQEYATLQNSLGSVYWKLSHYEDITHNLHQAIAAYNEAIKGYNPSQLPLDYAAVQNNLGITYWSLAKHEPPTPLLKQAIAAYCDALNYRTPEADPAACAITYNNLALAYWDLSKIGDIPTAQKGRYQKNAITAFEAALNTAKGVAALSQMDSAAIYHCLGDVHIQMVETAPSLAQTAMSLKKSLYSYIKAIEGLPADSPAFQGRLAAIVANLRTHYDHLGLAGQQAALNRIPPDLLSQVMMAM